MRAILVVPCYNEEKRLPVESFRSFAIDGVQLDYLFVNDGSTDATARVLAELERENPTHFRTLTLDRNSGKAEAVRRGMIAAAETSPDLVGFWDADLATPLSEIPSFIDVFQTHGNIDMVFGARVRLLGRQISRRESRHYFGRIGATLISHTLGLAVYDTQCGAKLFRVNDTLRQILSAPFKSRWIFDVEIIARLVKLRGREMASQAIYELPIREWHDVHGSKVKSRDFLRALRDLWKIRRASRE